MTKQQWRHKCLTSILRLEAVWQSFVPLEVVYLPTVGLYKPSAAKKLNLTVHSFKFGNHVGFNFSVEKTEIIEFEVQKMLEKGAIRHAQFHTKQSLSNLFVIPQKTGDLRPAYYINLRPLNEFVRYHHFKMEGLNSLFDLLSCPEFFTTFDSKDVYFTISIHPDHFKYLRFEWN